ncbi:hypothetical protein [Salinibacterium sp. ZJ450]|uniref:hypothetical protein n=1 Tax=Salinibacterium sp. ZJ450 TaxID=2708338 RepID=UPI00142216AA|nr:hypothetical protein [Salinibacterium sp. ZJ450]
MTALLGALLTVPLGAAHAVEGDEWAGPTLDVSIPTTSPSLQPTQQPTQKPTENVAPAPTETAAPANPGGSKGGAAAPAGTAADPAPTAPQAPTPGQAPKTDADRAMLSTTNPKPGQRATFTGTGYTPGEQVQLVIYSTPVVIASYPAGDDGRVVAEFDVPKDLAPGAHTAEATGWQSAHVTNVRFIIASDAAAFGETDHPASGLWWGLGIAGAVVLLGLLAWWLLRMRRPRAVLSGATA